jgi:hypothetical protein
MFINVETGFVLTLVKIPETWIKIGSAWEHQDNQGFNLSARPRAAQ